MCVLAAQDFELFRIGVICRHMKITQPTCPIGTIMRQPQKSRPIAIVSYRLAKLSHDCYYRPTTKRNKPVSQ